MKNVRYPHLFGRVYGRPLLLAPDKAFVVEQVFRKHLEAPFAVVRNRAFADEDWEGAAPDDTDDDVRITAGGVAVIDVMGTLVQRSSWMDAMSGITSYADIAADFRAAEANPAVKGILLEIDSSGGETNGCFDLADLIAASAKPVWAVANEAAYSAAYAIASAADRIVMPRTAGVGSIGVIALHVDQSQRDAKQGYTYTAVYAGDHKYDYTSHAPLPDAQRQALQADIDRLYGLFVDTVVANRGMTAEAVRATQAGLFHTQAAIEVGLADAAGTLDDAIAEFESFLADQTATRTAAPSGMAGFSSAVSAAPSLEPAMGQPAPAANTASITPETLDAARAEAETNGRTAGTRAGADAERARIAAILDSEEAQGRGETARALALESDMSVDAAKKVLAKSPKVAAAAAAARTPFEAAMDRVPNPKVTPDGADAGGDSQSDEDKALQAQIQRIANAGRPKTAA